MDETKTDYTIGGSEAAVILGLSPWATPLSLYLRKKGLLPEPDLDSKDYIKWGKRLEEPVAQAYSEETMRPVQEADPDVVTDLEGRHLKTFVPIANYGAHGVFLGIDSLGANFAHPDRPWMRCHPDRFILDPKRTGKLGILEAKTAMAMKKDEWDEEPPLKYQVQLAHNLEVMGCEWGSLAVLIGGNTFRWQDQERNEAFTDHLVEKEADFIRRLKENDPPGVTGSEHDRQALGDLFKVPVDSPVALPPEAIEWAEKLLDADARESAAKEEKTRWQNLIKQAMGEHTIGVLPNNSGRFSWKLVEKGEYVVKASSHRRFIRMAK